MLPINSDTDKYGASKLHSFVLVHQYINYLLIVILYDIKISEMITMEPCY